MKMLSAVEQVVYINTDRVRLEAGLAIPKDAEGIVLFAHGSGSSRKSPRNNFVAQVLQRSGLATLLMDLLTREEDMNYETRFDIDLLSERLSAAIKWVCEEESTKAHAIGLFGASTGAAAALQASVLTKAHVSAVVSRGGRPDLAERYLPMVQCPTLLVVGGKDDIVLGLNRRSYQLMKCEKDLVVVPGATHLFEEPGALEEVANTAASWFKKHLHRVGV